MGESKERDGLGFRNLDNFNKAMLAKQIWRMLNQPFSLVARMRNTLKRESCWRLNWITVIIYLKEPLVSWRSCEEIDEMESG